MSDVEDKELDFDISTPVFFWVSIIKHPLPPDKIVIVLIEGASKKDLAQHVVEGILHSDGDRLHLYNIVPIKNIDDYVVTHWMPRILPKPSWEE